MEKDLRVLVTGATSGLGKEMARQLGARGYRVAITGRRKEKLDKTTEEVKKAGAVDVLPLQGSVTELNIVREQYEKIKNKFGGLDWAILNAGVGDSENGKNFTAENYRWTFDTNVIGVCNWIEVVLPGMLEQKRGAIAGISSPAAWRGFPQTGSYSASKAALYTLLESLRVDLRSTGVDVVTVCPGWVKSEITARNDPKQMFILLETEDGAGRILKGIDKRKRVVHFPFPLTHMIRYLIRPLPSWIYDPLASKFIDRHKEPYVDESKQSE